MTTNINKFTSNFILGFFLILIIVAGTQPPQIGKILFTFILFLIGSYTIFAFSEFKSYLIGLNFSGLSLTRSVLYGSTFGGLFWVLTRYVPGASIGLPLLPGAISDQLKLLIIVIVAPIVEEIFFRGAVFGWLRSTRFGKRNIWGAILTQALFFALAHISAYVLGIYDYPTFTQGLSAVNANISSFIAAFIFGTIAGWLVSRDGIKNLVASIVLHMILNLIIFTSLVVIFV